MIEASITDFARGRELGGIVVRAMCDACERNHVTATLKTALFIVGPETDALRVMIEFDAIDSPIEYSFDLAVPKSQTSDEFAAMESTIFDLVRNGAALVVDRGVGA